MRLVVQKLSVRSEESFIINDISFALGDDQTLSIIGPSGSGKSTLIKALVKNLPETLRGFGLIKYQACERIGYVSQNLALWPHLNVEQTLQCAYDFAASRKNAVRPLQVDPIISQCDLDHCRQKRPKELSGGQQQRLALARSLIAKPQIIFLDEALAHCDVVARRSLIDLLLTLKKELHFALVFISHNLEDALEICEEALVLWQGQTFWQGPTVEVDESKFPKAWQPLWRRRSDFMLASRGFVTK